MFNRKYQAGQFICKYGSRIFTEGDIPDEFYIVLNGDVGIFIPRTDEEISRETKVLNALRLMAREAELGNDVEFEMFSTMRDLRRMPADDQNYIHQISKFTENTVTFKVLYLEEKLGCLPSKMLENPVFFNSVNISNIRTAFSNSRTETLSKKEACSERTPSSTGYREMHTALPWSSQTLAFWISKATTKYSRNCRKKNRDSKKVSSNAQFLKNSISGIKPN